MTEDVIAEIRQGRLRGKKVTSAVGREYYSFQGIPYAKPPIGPLRFKPPEPADPWDDIRDATKEGNESPQAMPYGYTGDEDCLFLNVYTPKWPVEISKPVMVWIHGGGFFAGSGNTDFHAPDFLVAEDVIVVTLNYRLGALGFLNLEGSDATTNNGLRDQVMALTWVKENIAQFGGDPNNVTIFGISAGGVSVHCLMLSPLAEGLFHRAIAMSGTAILPICFMPHDVSKQRSFRLAQLLGCTSKEPQEIADYLRTVPAEDIIKNQRLAMTKKDQSRLMTFPFTATEEINGDFFPDHPLKLMKQGRFNIVPFIAGVASAEGRTCFIDVDSKRISESEIPKSLERLLPMDLVKEIGTERSKEISEKLRCFYVGNPSENEGSVEQFVQMASDLMFVYPVYTSIKLHLESSHSPVYVYMFDHNTPTHLILLSDITINSVSGSSHGEEIGYLFYTTIKPNVYPSESAEAKVQSHLIKYWTQFAKTGDVSNVNDKIFWPPATKDKFQYLNIQENLRLDTNVFKERMEFLDDLYSSFERV